jgi:hypothetical protein
VTFGACTLTLDHIAALAGVCRSSVKNALRQAQALGFIKIEERRLTAWRNAPNRVTVVSPEWLNWLRLRKGTLSHRGGGKSVPPTNTSLRKEAESSLMPNAPRAAEAAGGRSRDALARIQARGGKLKEQDRHEGYR